MRETTERKLYYALAALLFLTMLLLNLLTPFAADDYFYSYSFATGERIQSVWEIFPSLLAHGRELNGRYAPHFFVQLFTMWPEWIFDLCNAAVFVFLALGLCRLGTGKGRPSACLFVIATGFLFLFPPDFGGPMLWTSGSLNYLWCGAAATALLQPFRRALLGEGAAPGAGKTAALCLTALWIGNCSESFSAAFTALLVLCFFASRFLGRKKTFWMLPVAACALLGWLFLTLAPGDAGRIAQNASLELGVYLERLVKLAQKWKEYLLWPSAAFLLLLGLCLARKAPVENVVFACLLAFTALLCHGSMILADYHPLRTFFWPVTLLAAACAILFPHAFAPESPSGRGVVSGLTLLIAFLLLVELAQALPNNYNRWQLCRARNAEIVEMREQGETDVRTFGLLSLSRYDMFNDVVELTADPDYRANVAAAKYYGVQSLWAERFE